MKNNWQLMFHEQGKLSYRGRIPLNPIAAASANEDGQQFQHFQRAEDAGADSDPRLLLIRLREALANQAHPR